jgi:hypothetical protein
MAGKDTHDGKGGVDDVPKCANNGCAKPGLNRCGGCMGVRYCSAECQKVHWKQGGHKHACKKSATPARPRHSTSTAPMRRGCGAGTCIICLNEDPQPIQSGCACRGDAGLAHVECRAEAAAHQMKSSGIEDGWWDCTVCKQSFTGVMLMGLAEAWRSSVQHLPADDEQQVGAANNLALAFNKQLRFAEAEIMYREVLVVRQRMLGSEHPNTLATAMNLANALLGQGKAAEAEVICRKTLAVRRRLLGPEHPSTLDTLTHLAMNLGVQGKPAESETMCREVYAAKQRALGPEHPATLNSAGGLATALKHQGKFAESEAMYVAPPPFVKSDSVPSIPFCSALFSRCVRSPTTIRQIYSMFRGCERFWQFFAELTRFSSEFACNTHGAKIATRSVPSRASCSSPL